MKYLIGLLIFLILVACSASLVYAYEVLTAPPAIKPESSETVDTVAVALSALGMNQPDWQTLVVSASQNTDVPVTNLWNTWAQLEDWPSWSPMVSSTHWLGASQWVLGSTFQQVLDLGSPLGRVTRNETISELTPGRSARWCNDQDGIRSCQIWMFEPLAQGGTRVTQTEVFEGSAVSALRPVVTKAWQASFEESVNGLIERARKLSQVGS